MNCVFGDNKKQSKNIAFSFAGKPLLFVSSLLCFYECIHKVEGPTKFDGMLCVEQKERRRKGSVAYKCKILKWKPAFK